MATLADILLALAIAQRLWHVIDINNRAVIGTITELSDDLYRVWIEGRGERYVASQRDALTVAMELA